MDNAKHKQIVSIIDDIDDMTIATVRDDGFPQATTVSYVNDGSTIYFGTSTDSQKAQNIGKSGKISLTINRPYKNWGEIEGLSIGGVATLISDPAEQEKVGGLMFEKFPQIKDIAPPGKEMDGVALFRIEPKVISIIDYTKEFGHTELVAL